MSDSAGGSSEEVEGRSREEVTWEVRRWRSMTTKNGFPRKAGCGRRRTCGGTGCCGRSGGLGGSCGGNGGDGG